MLSSLVSPHIAEQVGLHAEHRGDLWRAPAEISHGIDAEGAALRKPARKPLRTRWRVVKEECAWAWTWDGRIGELVWVAGGGHAGAAEVCAAYGVQRGVEMSSVHAGRGRE